MELFYELTLVYFYCDVQVHYMTCSIISTDSDGYLLDLLSFEEYWQYYRYLFEPWYCPPLHYYYSHSTSS